jgi:saccharopine dehydrogenase-like NADP-dependent oxidoreductase
VRFLCLGGAGHICREAALDLVRHTQPARITLADVDEAAGREVVDWLNDPRVDFLCNQTVTVAVVEFGVLEAVAAFLRQSKEGRETELHGDAYASPKLP